MKLLRNLVLVTGFSLAAASAALADGTALDGTNILPDPSLANSQVFPASVATGGVAAVSAAQDGPLENCSRLNPCAMVTPSRDRVTIAPEQAAVFEATHGPSHKTHRVLAGTPAQNS
jgi:hypothetical protein